MKVYISQGMTEKTNQEITRERENAVYAISISFPKYKIAFVPKLTQYLDKQPVYGIGKALEMMDGAELVAFLPDWEEYPNCRIERKAAEEYGYQIIDLDGGPDGDLGFPMGQMSL